MPFRRRAVCYFSTCVMFSLRTSDDILAMPTHCCNLPLENTHQLSSHLNVIFFFFEISSCASLAILITHTHTHTLTYIRELLYILFFHMNANLERMRRLCNILVVNAATAYSRFPFVTKRQRNIIIKKKLSSIVFHTFKTHIFVRQ